MNYPESFKKNMQMWELQATKLPWFKRWHTPLIWQEPLAHWFAGGQLNASYICLDVHLQQGRSDKQALIWESEDGQRATYTYQQLYDEVNRCAYVLKNMGITSGNPVIVYMPMIPETVITLLALARIGATHVVVFSGFSSHALKDRIEDVGARFIVTADYGVRRGKKINLKSVVDGALADSAHVEKVVVFDRAGDRSCMTAHHDVCYQDFVQENARVPAVAVESNHPLFILYTSGTTGKPKGIVHSTGGYLTYCYSTFQDVFAPKSDDIYWCTADVGWITGHSYVIYAPLMHGLTIFMHEGAPDYPDAGAWWSLIERYKITLLYTSPTALRMAIKAGDSWPATYDLSSLRRLGTVGEPINPEVWKWYYAKIGGSRCSIIDTWWQTETGGFMIAPYARNQDQLKPGSADTPLKGIDAQVLNSDGTLASAGIKGYLVIQEPWPGMCIGIYNDAERFQQVYWSKFKGMYYTGDYAYRDDDGSFWLLGRADEVLNIAGHRIGTAEIESAVVHHPAVAEAAAIGGADALKGERVLLFVTLKIGHHATPQMNDEIRRMLRIHIGAFVTAAEIYYIRQLPKTRSGKIMRRLLKGIIEGKALGDVSTLEDQASIDEIASLYTAISGELNSPSIS